MEELLNKLEAKFNEALDENYELKQRKQYLEEHLLSDTSSIKTLDWIHFPFSVRVPRQ